MTELARHIEALLLENDCVIIPGFGGFLAHYDPAKHIRKENLFLPPTRSIGFNPRLKLNDGILVQSYMEAYDTSFADAVRMVEKDVNQLINALHDEGKVYLENIGEIFYNIYGDYEFKPCSFKIASPSLYGLESFEIQELTFLRQKRNASNEDTVKEKKTYEIRINRAFLRNAAAMIAAIVMFFAFSVPVENTRVRQTNYAQLLPGELFEQIEKQSVAVTPVDVAPAIHPRNAVSASQAKADATTTTKISKPVVTKEIKVSKPETVSVAAVGLQESNPFHIIVIGGISSKDAEAIADDLRTKGFTQAGVLNDNGRIRVSICSFNDRNEAMKQLLKLRNHEAYQNAWLLTK